MPVPIRSRVVLMAAFLLIAAGVHPAAAGSADSSNFTIDLRDIYPDGAPSAGFTWSPASPTAGATVVFTDTSVGAPQSWSWDFDSNGVWDSSAQSPSHTFAAAGPRSVTLRVSNAYGSHQITKTLTVGGAAGTPSVTGVSRSYPGFFLEGTDVHNTFDVNVDWQGDPGTVSFAVDGGAAQVVSGTATGASYTFSMRDHFPAKWAGSNVAITPTNGGGAIGTAHAEKVFVFPYPTWLDDALSFGFGDLTIRAADGEVVAELSSEFPDPHLSKGCTLECAVNASCEDCIKVPSWVPYIGGTMDLLETYATVDGRVSSTGPGHFSVYGQTGFFALGGGDSGGGVLGSIGGSGKFLLYAPEGFQLTEASFNLKLEGAVGKAVGLIDAIPALSGLPPVIKDLVNPHAKLRGEIWPSLSLAGSFAQDQSGALKFNEAAGTLDMRLKVALQVDLVKGLSVTAWVAGGGSATVGVPEPIIRELTIGIEGGTEFEAWLWSFGPYTFAAGCTWTPTAGMVCEMDDGEKRQLLKDLERGVPLRPTVEDYREFGVFEKLVAAPLAKAASSKVPVNVAQTTVVSNIASFARPKLVSAGGGSLLLWEHQDLALPLEQAAGISWSFFDGAEWSAPALIADDTQAEYGIAGGPDASGKVVTVWSRIKDAAYAATVETTDDLPPYNRRFDVVSAVFDPTTTSWGPISPVTDDGAFDRGIEVSADGAGSLLLTWLSNPGGVYTSTADSPSSLLASLWSGSAWGAATTVASGLVGVARTAAAYDAPEAFVIVERDPTPEVAEDSVLDLYAFDGSGWTGPTSFAGGGVDNRMPTVAYDGSGEGHVVWVRDGDLVHATLTDSTPQVIRAGSGSLAFFSAQLLSNPMGHLTLLWQEVVDNGPANLFAMIYEPGHFAWSADRRLTEDFWLGHGLDAFYGDDGILRGAYVATEIERVTRDVDLGGETWTIENIPQKGQRNLRILEHSLIVDLAVVDADLVISPRRPATGDTVMADLTAHNAGDFTVGSFVVDLYVGEPAAGGTLVATVSVPGPVAAGAAVNLQMVFDMPEGGGTIVAVVDAADDVTELVESNNVARHYTDNRPPDAVAWASQTSAAAPPLTVDFNGSLSSDPDGDGITFAWAFADGSNGATTADVSHTFTTTGRFPATLAVTDTHGAVGTTAVVVTVGAPPAAPADLSVTGIGASWVGLQWSDTAADELGFLVFRSDEGAPFAQVASLPAGTTSYVDIDLQAQTGYAYQVAAFNDVGTGASSNTVEASTISADLFTDGFESGNTSAWSSAVQ